MLTYVLVSLTSWITAVKSEHDDNMILESPTILERTVKSYKQETKESKRKHRPQFPTDDHIYFKSIALRLFWKYLPKVN